MVKEKLRTMVVKFVSLLIKKTCRISTMTLSSDMVRLDVAKTVVNNTILVTAFFRVFNYFM